MSQLERVKNIKLMNEEKKNHFNPWQKYDFHFNGLKEGWNII